jgi:glycosyltransferase involved in cell wall biosynthesis
MRLFFEIPLILRKHRFHFAHFQYIVPFFSDTPMIVTTHDVLFLDFPKQFPLFYRLSRRYLFSRSVQKAAITTTVSEYSQERIKDHFRIPASKVLVLPSGVDASFFETYDSDFSKRYVNEKCGASRYILCVSRFEPRKNHELLLNSFLKLKLYSEDVYLVLVGHNSIPAPGFSRVLNSLPPEIRKFVIVNEKANDEDLYHFYRGAHVFAYPSVAEGFGLPPIEAGALRIPVLCSNLTAMADFSFFGRYHVDAANPHVFAGKLKEIF